MHCHQIHSFAVVTQTATLTANSMFPQLDHDPRRTFEWWVVNK